MKTILADLSSNTRIFYFIFNLPIALNLLQYIGETYQLDLGIFFLQFNNLKKYVFTFSHSYMKETHYLDFKHVHEFSFSNLNTPFFYQTRKKFTYIIWASHFVRNGIKLSISSQLITEVEVCQNVGLLNTRLPNLVNIDFFACRSYWTSRSREKHYC